MSRNGFAWGSLQLRDCRALVVGGGFRSLGLIAALNASGAQVSLVAPVLSPALEDLLGRSQLTWIAGDYRPEIVRGMAIALFASGEEVGIEQFSRDCQTAAVPWFDASLAFSDSTAVPDRLGKVTLVGGGPGDPGLITVRGREALLAADVVVVDRLAPLALLADLDPMVLVIDAAKVPGGRSMTQTEINRLLVTHARVGRHVVRLKGGDPFVFGRGWEEWQACADAGISVEVIPGVTSAIAVPGLAGIPVTHRGAVQSFIVISGHVPPGDKRSSVNWSAVAQAGSTIVVLMGVATMPSIANALMEGGLPGATPVACIQEGAGGIARQHRGVLAEIDALLGEGVRPPAIFVIGELAAFNQPGGSDVY